MTESVLKLRNGKEYRFIPEYPDYMINEDGTDIVRVTPGPGTEAGYRPGIATIGSGKRRYPSVNVNAPGTEKQRNRSIHYLVTTAFVTGGPIPEKYQIHHIDKDRFNNHYTNLIPVFAPVHKGEVHTLLEKIIATRDAFETQLANLNKQYMELIENNCYRGTYKVHHKDGNRRLKAVG
jgi:hypothetical protein